MTAMKVFLCPTCFLPLTVKTYPKINLVFKNNFEMFEKYSDDKAAITAFIEQRIAVHSANILSMRHEMKIGLTEQYSLHSRQCAIV